MFVNISLFKFKESTPYDEIDLLWKEVHKLKRLKGVASIYAGQSFMACKGLTHAVVVLCETNDALQAYKGNYDSVTLRQRAEEISETSLSFDLEDQN